MAYADVVLADSPVAYYKCDDLSGNLADSSGNGYTAIKTGTGSTITYRQPGIPLDIGGYSIYDDGNGKPYTGTNATHFDVPDNANTQVGDGPFTFEAWAKNDGSADTRVLVAWGAGIGPYMDYELYTSPNSQFNVGKHWVGPGIGSYIAPFDDPQGWHHLVWTKDGATNRMYVDGVDITPTITNQTLSNPTGAQLPHGLLAQEEGITGSHQNGFKGYVAHIAVYKSVLSAERIAAHFTAGKGATVPPPGFINRVVIGLI